MHVIWTVSPLGYQRITKRCPACNTKRDFIPSGAFRMNSQKKMLDVWSIYKCLHCDYTWNISLFSRLPVSRMDRELYARIAANDANAVLAFSHDRRVLRRNNAELSGMADFIVHEHWPLTLRRGQMVRVSIRLQVPFQVSLQAIIKKQLRLSSGELKRRITAGNIRGMTLRELSTRRGNRVEHEFWISRDEFYLSRNVNLVLASNFK